MNTSTDQDKWLLDTAAQLKKLLDPFHESEISKLPKPYKRDSAKGNCPVCGGYHGLPAMHLDYVGHAALTKRLLEVDPFWNWEPLAFGDDGLPKLDANGGLWIKLTVCGHTRLGYGDAQGKTGPDAMKERIGDALRNAAMRFGAALALWHKGEFHIEDQSPAQSDPPVGKEYDPRQSEHPLPTSSHDDYQSQIKAEKPLDAEMKPDTERPPHLISESQRKRLFALTKQADRQTAELKLIIQEFGYESSMDIKKSDYEQICKVIQDKSMTFS